MGIRFKYQPHFALVGAFAAGQADSGRRGRRYALDMLGQQQRHRQRMEELSARKYGLGGGARGGFGAVAGRWRQPTTFSFTGAEGGQAGQATEVPLRKTRQGRAQIEANRRAANLGKPAPFPDALPQFTSQEAIERAQEAIERAQEVKDRASQRGQKLTDEARRRGQELTDEAATAERESFAELEDDLQRGDLILSDTARQAINQVRADLEKDLPGLDESQQDEAIARAEERIRQAKKLGARLPEKDERPLGEQFQERTFTAPDGTIYQDVNGEIKVLKAPDDSAAKQQEAAQKAAQEKRGAAFAIREKLIKAQQALAGVSGEGEEPSVEKKQSLQAMVDLYEEQLEWATLEEVPGQGEADLGAPPPPPAPPRSLLSGGQAAEAASGAPVGESRPGGEGEPGPMLEQPGEQEAANAIRHQMIKEGMAFDAMDEPSAAAKKRFEARVMELERQLDAALTGGQAAEADLGAPVIDQRAAREGDIRERVAPYREKLRATRANPAGALAAPAASEARSWQEEVDAAIGGIGKPTEGDRAWARQFAEEAQRNPAILLDPGFEKIRKRAERILRHAK